MARKITELKASDAKPKRTQEEPQRGKLTKQRLAEERELLAKIGRIISSTLEIEKVYERFAKEVRKAIPFDRIAINIVYPETATVLIAYIAGHEVASRRPGHVVPLAGSLSGEVVRNRSSIQIQTEDIDEVVDRLPHLLPTFRAGFRSLLAVPLISKDEVVGVLHFRSFKPKAYTERDLDLAESISNQIAGAIASSKLYAEHKRAEEALRESEEMFRTLVTGAPIGLSIIARDGTYEYVNPKFVEIHGYTLEDVPTGKKWFEKAYPDPDYRQKVVACWIEDLKGARVGESRPRVFTVTCKNGSEKEIFFRPAALSDGRQLVTYEDVTERKRAEEALIKSEERYRGLVEDINDGYFLIQDEKFVYINQAFANLLGNPKEVILGKEFSSFFPQQYLERLLKDDTQGKVDQESIIQNDFEILRNDGKNLALEIRSRVVDYDGRSAIAGICKDITEKKSAEMALQQKVKELERWYRLTVDREVRMTQLKKKIQKLESELKLMKESKNHR